jgi:hypothetical protein
MREGEGSVYSGQRTGVIDAKPGVKIQSASASPGIAYHLLPGLMEELDKLAELV